MLEGKKSTAVEKDQGAWQNCSRTKGVTIPEANDKRDHKPVHLPTFSIVFLLHRVLKAAYAFTTAPIRTYQ